MLAPFPVVDADALRVQRLDLLLDLWQASTSPLSSESQVSRGPQHFPGPPAPSGSTPPRTQGNPGQPERGTHIGIYEAKVLGAGDGCLGRRRSGIPRLPQRLNLRVDPLQSLHSVVDREGGGDHRHRGFPRLTPQRKQSESIPSRDVPTIKRGCEAVEDDRSPGPRAPVSSSLCNSLQ